MLLENRASVPLISLPLKFGDLLLLRCWKLCRHESARNVMIPSRNPPTSMRVWAGLNELYRLFEHRRARSYCSSNETLVLNCTCTPTDSARESEARKRQDRDIYPRGHALDTIQLAPCFIQLDVWWYKLWVVSRTPSISLAQRASSFVLDSESGWITSIRGSWLTPPNTSAIWRGLSKEAYRPKVCVGSRPYIRRGRVSVLEPKNTLG